MNESQREHQRQYHLANREKRLAANRARYAANPEKARARNRAYRDANRENINAAARVWHASNREKLNAARRAYYDANREKHRVSQLIRTYIRTYRLTLKAVQQNKCAICGAESDKLCVDHDHATGKVRGLLCTQCNTAIGMMNDDPATLRAAADYLEKTTKKPDAPRPETKGNAV